MAIEGEIRSPGNKVVARYRVDENAITFSDASPDVLSKLKDGLRKEWGVIVANPLKDGRISEVYEWKRPAGLSTVAWFHEMLVQLDYIPGKSQEVS